MTPSDIPSSLVTRDGRLLQNGEMVNQVIVRKLRSDEPVFEAISTDQSTRPLSLENFADDVYVPRLGSDDLLHLAAFASRAGYFVDGFVVVGRHGGPLDDDAGEVASSRLQRHLESGATYAASVFAREYPGHFVSAVSLTSPEMHSLVLRRFGVVETDDPSLPIAFLESAWKQVHFV